ncbi:MAG: hypothetical protein MK180_02555 [Rhodobacteraceae bacterium]|nr:hypothetical protein [Paracoccaceae bacterium]
MRAWNRDQTLETAFQASAVWVYQALSRTAGQSTLSGALADFGYGNANIGAPDQLTTY